MRKNTMQIVNNPGQLWQATFFTNMESAMLRNLSGLLVCLLILSGCGQMGPLYMPPPTPAKNADQSHLDTMIKSA